MHVDIIAFVKNVNIISARPAIACDSRRTHGHAAAYGPAVRDVFAVVTASTTGHLSRPDQNDLYHIVCNKKKKKKTISLRPHDARTVRYFRDIRILGISCFHSTWRPNRHYHLVNPFYYNCNDQIQLVTRFNFYHAFMLSRYLSYSSENVN